MTTPGKGGDLEPNVEEQVEANDIEDQDLDGFDNLDDAADALLDDEPDDEEPTEETEPDDEPEAETEDEESDTGDAIVELPDGETLTLSEIADLKANGLRAADYTHKTTELAREREAAKAIETQYAERLQYAESTLQNISGFVEGLIPPPPPIELAQADPGAYTQQKAIRDAAIAELQKLTEIGEGVKAHRAGVSEADMTAYRERERAALVKAMPHLSDPVKRQAFDKVVADTAQQFGFTADEIAQTADHRILQMVHYARMGKRSEANRNNAKRRVQTPATGKAKPAQMSAQQSQNRNAMQRLSKSGSINDAMEIDFD